jgi:hypothetical protein
MACACGGKSRANVEYQVVYPDGTSQTTTDMNQARVLRAAGAPGTVIKQVPKKQ